MSLDMSRINDIIKKTINAIDDSRNAIYDIAENSRKECYNLREEMEQLKKKVNDIIVENDRLEELVKKSRQRLAHVSKNFDKYSQDEVRKAYEDADRCRIDLAVNREREKMLIVKRNELELRVRDSNRTVEKAEQLVTQVGTAMNYLKGDLSNLNIHMEDVEKKKYLVMRIIKAQEEERSRVAREIHDGPAQSMSNVVLKAEVCEKLMEADMNSVKNELRNLKRIVRDCLTDVRRIIYDLRPMSLEDLGLVPTLQKYIERFQYDSKINVEFIYRGANKDMDSQIILTAFRIIQEGLNNIKKHADAKEASILIEFTPLNLSIRITDDGKGFDPDVIRVDKDDESGFGIFSMKERVELINGEIKIQSEPQRGTTIKVLIPY